MSEAALLDSVLGLPVHLMDDYISWLRSRLQQKIGTHVITLNAEMTMQAEQQKALAQAIHQAELVVPDGAGIVLYMLMRGKRIQRCPGIELAELLLESIGHTSMSCPVFFYGGSPGVTTQAAKTWQQRSPHLHIVGTEHGYLSSTEAAKLAQTLQKLQPSLILVGLGVPRQELWIAQNRHLCPQSTWIGVGGSFDIWAGMKSRAPAWLGDNHLEWLYRLYQEPWRWRRMSALPKFAGKALVSRLTQI